MKPGLHWSLLPQYHEENIVPYVHPNLNRESLMGYLWETHIYPGKRIDYLGNPLPRPVKTKDEDWLAGVKLTLPRLMSDLGAEGLA